MAELDWQRIAAMLFCGLVGIAAVLLAWRYLFPVLLPFLISLLLSRAVRSPARRLSQLLHAPEGAVAVGVLLLTVTAGGTGLWLLLWYLGREALALVLRLLSDGTLADLLEGLQAWGTEMLAHLGVTEAVLPSLGELFFDTLGGIAASLPAALSAALASLPAYLFFALLVLVASVYFCLDKGASMRALARLLPDSMRERLAHLKARCGVLMGRYLRAYLCLFFITVGILFVGFLLLGVEHALLLSLLIAAADLLPVIGVGTVLIPWGLFLLLTGEGGRGIALLVLYLSVSIVRQLAEPRLVGKSLGVHPLLTLLITYAGLRLFGFWGLVLSPLAAVAIGAVAERVPRSEGERDRCEQE